MSRLVLHFNPGITPETTELEINGEVWHRSPCFNQVTKEAYQLRVKAHVPHDAKVCRIANAKAESLPGATITPHGLTCGDVVEFDINEEGELVILKAIKEREGRE